MKASEYIKKFENDEYKDLLMDTYEDASLLAYQKERYIQALKKFIELFSDKDVHIFTAAGRTEVSGNHTDHQHGRVLAASVNLDSIAVAAPVSKDEIRVISQNFDIQPVSLNSLQADEKEYGTSEGLIRGVAAGLQEAGYQIGGFEAYVTSDVLNGAGLSSSASFEVLMGMILSGLYNDNKIDLVEISKVSQMAENKYFGKPCGLMDQCACAVGGLITIDFKDPSSPVVEAIPFDFNKYGYSLCIVDTKADHADLTDDYAAIPYEMKEAAGYFGKDVLRDVDENEFYENISKLREKVSDRAVLRAIHFFNENKRVEKIVQSLKDEDFQAFLKSIESSGNSSFRYLQNIFTSSHPDQQAVSLALALSEGILKDHGVCRVHGGGFAGTIQAFVKNDYVDTYKEEIEKVFGQGSCHILKIRKYGGKELL